MVPVYFLFIGNHSLILANKKANPNTIIASILLLDALASNIQIDIVLMPTQNTLLKATLLLIFFFI